MTAEPEVFGPIDFVLLEYPADRTDGSAARAVIELVRNGTIRLWDVVLVAKGSDGGVRAVELDELPADIPSEIAEMTGSRSGLVGEEDVLSAAEALEPGTLAALLVYENAWAVPFIEATLGNGGGVVANGRIPYDIVFDALDELDDEN